LLRSPSFRDVPRDAQDARGSALVVPDPRHLVLEPDRGAVFLEVLDLERPRPVRVLPALGLEPQLLLEGLDERTERGCTDRLIQGVLEPLLGREAEHFLDGRTHVGRAQIQVCRPEDVRHLVGQKPQSRFAVSQRILGSLAIRDVHGVRGAVEERPVVLAQRLELPPEPCLR